MEPRCGLAPVPCLHAVHKVQDSEFDMGSLEFHPSGDSTFWIHFCLNLFFLHFQLQELRCGHLIHSHCFRDYTRYNYTCPVCLKSIGDMTVYFRMLDSLMARDTKLPPEYANRRQVRQLLKIPCSVGLGFGILGYYFLGI